MDVIPSHIAKAFIGSPQWHINDVVRMLSESFIAATLSGSKPTAHLGSAFKDVGIFTYEFQPQTTFRQGFKKSSVQPRGLAISERHIYAAQAGKSVVHVYNREKGNQEATVPLPERIQSITYATKAAVLIIGTEDGKLVLWEVATGRITTSSASHLQGVSHLAISLNNDLVVSGSADSNLYIWSLSRLLSFTDPQPIYENALSHKSHVQSFTSHRSEITALTIGHSASSTNFAVSTSADRTCYIWHIETSQILRTLLFPAITLCAAIDPADRSIYFGCETGNILSVDLFSEASGTSKSSLFDGNDTAIPLSTNEAWVSPSEVGSTNCITLSYDGTSLLSGHESGKIVRWDVAKHRVISEVANLIQPVSHLEMNVPTGLGGNPTYCNIPTVVKPRLELGVEHEEGTTAIPSMYVLQSQITRNRAAPHYSTYDSSDSLFGPGFSAADLDQAVRAIIIGSRVVEPTREVKPRDLSFESQLIRLKEENAALRTRLDAMLQRDQASRKRHLDRQQRRAEFKKQKVEAFRTAKKNGKDADAAMRYFEDQERALEDASDEEYLGKSYEDIDK